MKNAVAANTEVFAIRFSAAAFIVYNFPLQNAVAAEMKITVVRFSATQFVAGIVGLVMTCRKTKQTNHQH